MSAVRRFSQIRTAEYAGWPGQVGGLSLRSSMRARRTRGKLLAHAVEHAARQRLQQVVRLARPDADDHVGDVAVVDGVRQHVAAFGDAGVDLQLQIDLELARRATLDGGRAVTAVELDAAQARWSA